MSNTVYQYLRPLGTLCAASLLSVQAQSAIFFSEYIEGSSSNKALEIFNSYNTAIDLSNVTIERYTNGASTPGATLNLTGSLDSEGVFVVVHTSANAAIKAVADLESGNISHNGDDAYVLKLNGVIVDSFGKVGEDPGSEWSNNGVGTQNETLRRKSSVQAGDVIINDAFEPDAEWDTFAQDASDGLGAHTFTGTLEDYDAPTPVDLADDCGNGEETKISAIQGEITDMSSDASPMLGQSVTVEAIVTADFTRIDDDNRRYNGFWIQEEEADYDANAATSEGLFVYSNDIGVTVGDKIRLVAAVAEYAGQTQLSNVSDYAICSQSNALPAEQALTLPVADMLELEAVEGMRVSYSQGLIVSDLFGTGYGFGNYGQFVVSSKLHFQPTEIAAPESAEAQAAADARPLDFLLIDDGQSSAYPSFIPFPDDTGFSALNPMRIGYTVPQVSGLMHGFYESRILIPTDITIVPTLARTAAPEIDIEANLVVVGMNVLNYFNGNGDGTGFGEDLTGEAKSAFRGAETYEAFQMQEAKIVAAIQATDADIVGLMELENDGFSADSSIADLVEALNNGEPAEKHYSYVDPGMSQIGDDAIVVGLIYRADKVSLKGDAVVLDETNSPTDGDGVLFNTDKNRPALIQSFEYMGNTFTVAVNHLKSKGSSCGEPNEGDDGQGNCNIMRTRAAEGLAQFLATDPTSSDSDSVMILGDLNAYSKEDPMVALETAGYTNLKYTDKATEAQPYSYSFGGFLGSLDHAMVTDSLIGNVLSVDAWHINSVEDSLMDYYTEATGQPYDSVDNYANADAYRSSDHDPIVVGLKFEDNTTPAPKPKPEPPAFGSVAHLVLVLLGVAGITRRTLKK